MQKRACSTEPHFFKRKVDETKLLPKMKLSRQYQWHRYRHRCQLPFLFGFSCQLGLCYCQGSFCWFLVAQWLVWLYRGHGVLWILGVGNVGELRVCLALPLAAQKRPHNALALETEISYRRLEEWLLH